MLNLSNIDQHYPIGSKIRHIASGLEATIDQHGATSSTMTGLNVMLWTENRVPWPSNLVEIVTRKHSRKILNFTIHYFREGRPNREAVQEMLDASGFEFERWGFTHGCSGIRITPKADHVYMRQIPKCLRDDLMLIEWCVS